MVTAKFRVTGINGNNVRLDAVEGDTDENKNFWEATPSGTIELYITNEKALDQLEEGEEYYVNFNKARSKGIVARPGTSPTPLTK